MLPFKMDSKDMSIKMPTTVCGRQCRKTPKLVVNR